MAQPRLETDPERLDVAWIHRTVSAEYWARGRSREETRRVMAACRNYGAFVAGGPSAEGPTPAGEPAAAASGERQVAYARVLSDGLVLAYLFDVVVDPAWRGRGYGRWLVARVFEDPAFKEVRTWMLGTRDAQGLYEPFGFRALVPGEPLMVRQVRPPVWRMPEP